MNSYYCDGSFHQDYGIMGLGIVYGDTKKYVEKHDECWKEQMHEVRAIHETIDIIVESEDYPAVIYNDDKNLVNRIQTDTRSVYKRPNNKYQDLIDRLKQYKIKLKAPVTEQEKKNILKAHHVSRTYLKEKMTNAV